MPLILSSGILNGNTWHGTDRHLNGAPTRALVSSESGRGFYEHLHQVTNATSPRKNWVWRWGYNAGGPGNPLKSGDHTTSLVIESYYETSPGVAQTELYWQHSSPQGKTIRPWAMNIAVAGGDEETPYAEMMLQLSSFALNEIDGITPTLTRSSSGPFVFYRDIMPADGRDLDLGVFPGNPFRDGVFSRKVYAPVVETENLHRADGVTLIAFGANTVTIGASGATGAGESTIIRGGGETQARATPAGFVIDGRLGFYGADPLTKRTITGSRANNTALASLLSNLDALGLITNATTT